MYPIVYYAEETKPCLKVELMELFLLLVYKITASRKLTHTSLNTVYQQ